jgi:3',5'-cyclic AMP phosphodiesterase CpdA
MPAISRFTLFFITLNWGGSISDSQINWIEEDLISTDSENVFMFMHHNPLWETTSDSLVRKPYQNRAKLLSLIDEHDVDMVLAGHVHFDNVTIENETIFLTTTTPESEIRVEDGYWGYRLIDIENGEIENYNYKEPKYSIPSYRLNHSFIDPFTANIQNDLEMDVNVLLRFKLPKNNYDVTNGEIIQQRENHFMKEIYVISEVEKQSELRVTLTEIA